MKINLSDSVIAGVLKLGALKLQAIEEGQVGNIIINEKITKLRYLVSEIVMVIVLSEIRNQQSNPIVEGKTNSNPDTI